MEKLLEALDTQVRKDHPGAQILDNIEIVEVWPQIEETPAGFPAKLYPEATWISIGVLHIYTVVVEVLYDKNGYHADYGYDVVSREWHCWAD